MSADLSRRLIVGVGNAGVAVLDLLAMAEPAFKGLLAVNNDPESLAGTVVRDRLNVPAGDPADGFLAIDEEFGKTVAGASSVVLCGGLGGETASFLLPALAVLAKSNGITVAACVGMPFSFEGKRRTELAETALGKLHAVCDAVAVIGNERLSGGTPSTAAVGEAFALADRTLLSCTRALHGMLSTSGPVRITRADLKNVLGVPGAKLLFGSGSASGSNRLHEALEAALSDPLLNQQGKTSPGSALPGVRTVLLLLQGPSDLSFAEVQTAVSGIERIAGDKCQIKTGVLASLAAGSPLTLSIIASSGEGTQIPKAPEASASEVFSETIATQTVNSTSPATSTEEEVPQPIRKSAKLSTSTARQSAPSKQTQGTLDLDTYQRGRFDKSEPTIVAGEDLDVPTFLRKGIKLSPPRRS
jgi:cell division protein FtsZ